MTHALAPLGEFTGPPAPRSVTRRAVPLVAQSVFPRPSFATLLLFFVIHRLDSCGRNV